MVTLLGGGSIAHGVQQIASQSMQLSLVMPLPRRLDHLCSLGEAIVSFNQLPEHSMGLGEPHIQSQRTCNSPVARTAVNPCVSSARPSRACPRVTRPHPCAAMAQPKNSGNPCSVESARASAYCWILAERMIDSIQVPR